MVCLFGGKNVLTISTSDSFNFVCDILIKACEKSLMLKHMRQNMYKNRLIFSCHDFYFWWTENLPLQPSLMGVSEQLTKNTKIVSYMVKYLFPVLAGTNIKRLVFFFWLLHNILNSFLFLIMYGQNLWHICTSLLF